MPAPYDYATAGGYTRTRADWLDFPSTSTPITQTQLDQFDQAIADLKGVVLNAKDFNAKGDGVTNDTTALQNAINATPNGGTLFIPAGLYLYTTALSVTKPISMVGVGYSSSFTLGSILSPSGAINGITVGVGGDYSTFQNFKIYSATATGVHGISVTGASTILNGAIRNVFAENFKAGAGFYLGQNSISWTCDTTWAQGNRYGYKLESTTPFNSNNHVLLHPTAINNATSGHVGTQYQLIGVNGCLILGPLSEVTDTTATVEGVDIQGCLSVVIQEPYIEHSNTGKALKILKNGTTFSEDVRVFGGTWQTGVLSGGAAAAYSISLEGDRRTQIFLPSLSLQDESANSGATDTPVVLSLSTATYEPKIEGTNLWKLRITDAGARNPEIIESAERYRRTGGLYETGTQTNLIYWSEKISNWTVSSANITVTDNQATSPDGLATTASKVNKTANSGDDHVRFDNLATNTNEYTFSVWLKADTAHRAAISIVEPGVGTRGSRIVNVGLTWRRFYISAAGTGVGSLSARVQPVASVDTGNGYVYMWGAQFELGNLSDYIVCNIGGPTVTRPTGFSTSKRATFGGAVGVRRNVVTYSASITIDASLGNHFSWTATNGTAFTINAPTNPVEGQRITITIRNTSGGALGVITWNAAFKMAAWTSPATANSRSIDFRYDGTNWVDVGRTAADVPN